MKAPNALSTAAAFAALAFSSAAALAADTSPPPPPPPAAPAASPAPQRYNAPVPAPLAGVQAHLQAARWGAAIDELKRVNLERDADWNNLMGYALRKQATPDLAGAQRHYDAALRIDPNHLGALAYVGELALMRKDLPAAEAFQARLERACGLAKPCGPLEELKTSIAAFKAGR